MGPPVRYDWLWAVPHVYGTSSRRCLSQDPGVGAGSVTAVEKQTHDLHDNWPLAILVSQALHKHSHAWAFPTGAQTPI